MAAMLILSVKVVLCKSLAGLVGNKKKRSKNKKR